MGKYANNKEKHDPIINNLIRKVGVIPELCELCLKDVHF
jgi:hypothetical protein